VADWDEITNVAEFGDVAGPEDTSRDRAYLIVLAGSHVGEMFKVGEAPMVIGRSAGAQVRLQDDGISRQHCRVYMRDGAVFIEDNDSRNGTYCNGVRITRHQLHDGDKIQVGRRTILKFTYNDRIDETFQRNMYDSALRDGLTNAYNKRYFVDRVANEFKFARRHATPLSLILIDLDHFKAINDEHGHVSGDNVLAEVARRIAGTIRSDDVFARFGGEEFAVICRAVPPADAALLAERMRAALIERPVTYKDTDFAITASFGVSGLPDHPFEEAEQLLTAADDALYQAKNRGRDQVVVYDGAV